MSRGRWVVFVVLAALVGCGAQDAPEVDRKADRAAMRQAVSAFFGGSTQQACAAISDALADLVYGSESCRNVRQDGQTVDLELTEHEYADDGARARVTLRPAAGEVQGRVRFARSGDRLLLDSFDIDFLISLLDAGYVPAIRKDLAGTTPFEGKPAAAEEIATCLPDEILAASDRDLRRGGYGVARGDATGARAARDAMEPSLLACLEHNAPGRATSADMFVTDRFAETKAGLDEKFGESDAAALFTIRLCYQSGAAPPKRHRKVAEAMTESAVKGETSHGGDLDKFWSRADSLCGSAAESVWKGGRR